MQQLVLIVPAVGQKFDMNKAKQQIVSYVGTRMVEQTANPNTPGVFLREELSKEDKDILQQDVFKAEIAGALVFISIPENILDDNAEYISATATSDEI